MLNGVEFQAANFTDADLQGASMKGNSLFQVVWSNTICPDGSNSNNDGGACDVK
jgi:uncharacterized protein YjbI with pentapeptide repeats